MLITQKVLEDFLIENNTESGLIMDLNGKVLFSVNLTYEDSIAAMSEAILSMCDKFLDDLEKGFTKQMFLKTNDGYTVFTKTNSESVLIVFSKFGTNLGMFLHKLEIFSNN